MSLSVSRKDSPVPCARIQVHQIPVCSYGPVYNPPLEVPVLLSTGGLYRDRRPPLGGRIPRQRTQSTSTPSPPARERRFETFTLILYIALFPRDSKSPNSGVFRDSRMSSSSCHSPTAGRDSQGRKDILIFIIPLVRYSTVFSERSEDFWQGSTNLLHQPEQHLHMLRPPTRAAEATPVA